VRGVWKPFGRYFAAMHEYWVARVEYQITNTNN